MEDLSEVIKTLAETLIWAAEEKNKEWKTSENRAIYGVSMEVDALIGKRMKENRIREDKENGK